jgi:hypothetical protein
VAYSRTSSYLLHGDPAPTDADEVRQVIRILQTATDKVTEANNTMSGIGSDTAMWTGLGADAFNRTLSDLRTRLTSAQSAYLDAVEALQGWLRVLEPLQAAAVRVAREADTVGPQTDEPTQIFFYQSVPAALQPLQQRRDSIAHQAAQAAEMCAKALDEAIRVVQQYEKSAWDVFAEFLTEFRCNIDKVQKILGVVAIVLGVVALVGGLAAATVLTGGAALVVAVGAAVAGGGAYVASGISAGLAVVDEAASFTLAAGGKQSWGEFREDTVWNGLDVVSFGLSAKARALEAGADVAVGQGLGALQFADDIGGAPGRMMAGYGVNQLNEAADAYRAAQTLEVTGLGLDAASLHEPGCGEEAPPPTPTEPAEWREGDDGTFYLTNRGEMPLPADNEHTVHTDAGDVRVHVQGGRAQAEPQ